MNTKSNIRTIRNLIILDESGSMWKTRQVSIDGANETIQTIKAANEEYSDQEHYLTFVTFSNRGGDPFRTLFYDMYIEYVRPLSIDDYQPMGNTPLWDTMGFALTKLETETSEDDLVLVTIITDGYENASRYYNGGNIKALVKRLRAKGWVFAYLGANQDAIDVAGRMGINNACPYISSPEGTRDMWQEERESRVAYYERARQEDITQEQLQEGYFSWCEEAQVH